jgi:uncharacterized tellurite resistance protein B-like protein
MVIHASFEDFLLFLYVYISRSDNTYDPKELTVILDKMKGLFPEDTDFEKKLYLALRSYNTFDKSKLNDLFEDTLKHFQSNNSDHKERIITDLLDIVKADGKVEASETNALNALKKTIDLLLK